MAKIGVFGDVVFEVSSKKVMTFSGFKRSGSGRWADHERIGMKPISEFIGPGKEEISFTVQLNACLGVNPQLELDKLRRIRDKGETRGIIIGEDFISKSLWTLEAIQETHKTYDANGQLLVADVELTIKEYPRL
ncbi:phage tail protein [Schinkia sp. CFF1]